jgi:hypothetical protein
MDCFIFHLTLLYEELEDTILNARRTNENVNNSNQVEYNRHYCDLTNNGPNVPGQTMILLIVIIIPLMLTDPSHLTT